MKELALQTSTNQQEIENIKQIMDDAGVMDTASARRAMNNLKKKDMALYKYAISFKCKFGDLLSNSPSFPPPPLPYTSGLCSSFQWTNPSRH